MLRNIFCWKGFGPVTGSPSFPGANFQQMVIARLSLGLSFLGLRNFLKLCHDEKPCTWWLGEKGLGSLQSRLARMIHHEYDALKGYRFLGGAISFYSVSCMSDVIFNPSLLNWSSLILTVAHMDSQKLAVIIPMPIPSMYGIFTYFWLIFMVNVAKYTIHGCYGYAYTQTFRVLCNPFGWSIQRRNFFQMVPYRWITRLRNGGGNFGSNGSQRTLDNSYICTVHVYIYTVYMHLDYTRWAPY